MTDHPLTRAERRWAERHRRYPTRVQARRQRDLRRREAIAAALSGALIIAGAFVAAILIWLSLIALLGAGK